MGRGKLRMLEAALEPGIPVANDSAMERKELSQSCASEGSLLKRCEDRYDTSGSSRSPTLRDGGTCYAAAAATAAA